MRRKKAALVINPRSGQNVAKLADVMAVLAAADWKTEVTLKEYGGQTMELATDAAEKGSDLVVAYGGDGTLNQVVNGVMQSKGQRSIVGVIPGGTANQWAAEIGVPVDPVKAALMLIESDACSVDVGHVAVEGVTFPDAEQDGQGQNGKKKRKKGEKASSKARQHFLLMAGLGIDAAVMQGVSKPLKYQVGTLAVGVSAAKVLPEQHPFPVEIRTNDAGLVWKGEARQVVIGNTRRYANFVEITPDAHIDDGVLDICVITQGNPLTTMGQIFSLLLKRTPDNLTAEYFHGAHLTICVPASIGLQLDGTTVKLKDYLSRSDREMLAHVGDDGEAMVAYRFDAIPHALQVAIPRSYDNGLFEEADATHHQQAEREQASSVDPEAQQPAETSSQEHDRPPEHQDQNVLQQAAALNNGRKVRVVGVCTDPIHKSSYIVAGSTTKPSTGEDRPAAVCIGESTKIRKATGEGVSPDELLQLREGAIIVVEGKKSKRGVIRASQVVIEQ